MHNRTVLVCVTPQVSCRNLITCGHAIAQREDAEMRIICVFSQKACYSPDFEALEILNESSMEYDSEMTVFFNDSPAEIIAETAKRMDSPIIVLGFPGNKSSGFIGKLHAFLPDTPLCMVDDDCTVYKIEKKDMTQCKKQIFC